MSVADTPRATSRSAARHWAPSRASVLAVTDQLSAATTTNPTAPAHREVVGTLALEGFEDRAGAAARGAAEACSEAADVAAGRAASDPNSGPHNSGTSVIR